MLAVRPHHPKPVVWVWVLMLLVSGLNPVAYLRGTEALETVGAVHSHVAMGHPEAVQEQLTPAWPEGTTACCHRVLSLCVAASTCFVPSHAVRLIPMQGQLHRLLDTEPILKSVIHLVPTPPPRV